MWSEILLRENIYLANELHCIDLIHLAIVYNDFFFIGDAKQTNIATIIKLFSLESCDRQLSKEYRLVM